MSKISIYSKIDLLGDEYLVEFVNDTITFYLKNQRVAFLSKYAEVLKGAHNIAPIRELVIDIIKMCLRKETSLDIYK